MLQYKLINDLPKLCSLTTMNVKKIEFNEPSMKEGSFLKFYLEDLKIFVFMKIVNIDTPINKKYGCLRLETIGTKIDKLPINIEYKIKKINNNQTQISIMHRFRYDMNKNFIKNFRINKQNSLKKYKIYIEEKNENKN